MKKKCHHYQKIFILLFIYSNFALSQTLQEALLQAGDNKNNLTVVLEHYKNTGEKVKLEAAVFLIKNMPSHESQKYEWVDYNDTIIPFSEFDYDDFGLAIESYNTLKDSLNIKPKIYKQKDISVISSKLLIENIDLAFNTWKNNTWSQYYNFNTFCEYILPYRSLIEPLEDWRKEYQFLVEPAIYNLEDETDPVEVCTHIINELKGFSFVYGKNPLPAPLLSPQQLLFRRQGSCPELANLVLLASRSMGVAVTFDFTPHYAASSNRHYWNTVIDKQGNHIPFNGNSVGDQTGLPHTYTTNHKRMGKVFRQTYSINKNTLANKLKTQDIPISFLRNKNIIDVTHEYVSTGEINFVDYNSQVDSIAYLNVFNRTKWRIIDWAEKTEASFSFKNLGKDIVYLPSFFKNKKQFFSQYPILLDAKGRSHTLKPDFSKVINTTLSRTNEITNAYTENNSSQIEIGEKYMLLYWDGKWKRADISIATKVGVFFKNIPSNALFLMLPAKPDGFERIFILDPVTKQLKWY
ncbi:hypothetical protein SAMN05444411_102256 [Lutibacter oricola]|uniref:Transglutaminase-like domain-containing protein n=1 Tax=Lutibacter oricola TaxID=762486 RepID=A0A1H2WQ75_9FLAO|nr:transglutaminase domain-containing protein [Lutibacter oricola]SDW82677.1 hypothetical protein SAMN05444411_102256 [Lutibacter oricola]